MDRTVSVGLFELLDLVDAAESYGFDNHLLNTLAEWTGWVTDDEITSFADHFLSEEMVKVGYGPDDRDEAREKLFAWREKYCDETSSI